VTVKCRIGIDDQDSETVLEAFVSTVAAAGCQTFIVHARKAWLQGLSPRENREIPPLDYGRVHRLKARHPDLVVVINGGITTLSEAEQHLNHVDGVMLGRAAYQTPWLLSEVDNRIYGDAPSDVSPHDVVERMKPYISQQLAEGVWLQNISRHMLGLFHGVPGGRLWRRVLSEEAPKPGAGLEVLDKALAAVQRAEPPRAPAPPALAPRKPLNAFG
jgi:tRNA-dihydrouridine synthase A